MPKENWLINSDKSVYARVDLKQLDSIPIGETAVWVSFIQGYSKGNNSSIEVGLCAFLTINIYVILDRVIALITLILIASSKTTSKSDKRPKLEINEVEIKIKPNETSALMVGKIAPEMTQSQKYETLLEGYAIYEVCKHLEGDIYLKML